MREEPVIVSVRRMGDALGRRWERLTHRVYLLDLLVQTVQEYGRRRCGIYAAAMSYYVIFSFFPMLIFVVAVTGLIVRDPDVQRRVAQTILQAVPEGINIEENVESVLANVGRTGHGVVGLFALLASFWSASTMFNALRKALNSAFDISKEPSFILAKALDLAGVLGVFLFVVIAIVLLFLAFFVVGLGLLLGQMVLPQEVIDILPLSASGRVIVSVVSYLNSFIFMLVIYRLVPERRLRVRDLWWGAAGFETAKYGFGLYLANVGSYQEIYGALGTAVASLAFVYLVAAIVLFVAVLMSVRLHDRAGET
jgi:membrane protein